MGSKAHTSPRGKATTSRGKSSLIALCLAVLFCLYLNVANSVFSSNVGRGEKETAAASGDFASTRLAENSIRTGGDYDYDDDDVGNDVGGEGSGQTMRTTIGHEGSLDAVDQTATAAAVGGDYELAASESHGFFYDVSADSWNLLRDIYLKHDNHRDPSRPLLFSEHDPKSDAPWDKSAAAWYQNNYEPNFSCMFEKRIGGMRMNGDGPKWVRAHRHYYVTLSLGLLSFLIIRSLVVFASKHLSRYAIPIGSENLHWRGRQETRITEGVSSIPLVRMAISTLS